jgi:hypothetical protein
MTFSKQDATAAYTLLGVRYHRDQKWIKALMRGWENLERRRWQWENETLLMQSTSDPNKRYTVTADGCQCHAAGMGGICDHMTSWWVCHEASIIARRPPKMRRHYHDFNAAVDELF